MRKPDCTTTNPVDEALWCGTWCCCCWSRARGDGSGFYADCSCLFLPLGAPRQPWVVPAVNLIRPGRAVLAGATQGLRCPWRY
eukprot:8698101-Alexandrium_andersonii.AAC.1